MTNSFLSPSNSFYTPPPTPSGTSIMYKPGSLGGLEPLVSDLITTKEAPNKYLKPTIVGDSAAINERLKQYQGYDTASLGGLASYFAPQAAARNNGQLIFKPEDFNRISSGLSGLSSSDYEALKPLLGGTSAVGSMGGQQFFKAPDLQSALSGYSALPSDTWNKYSGYSSLSNVKPLANVGGQFLFSKGDASRLGNVANSEDFINRINSLIPTTREEIYQGAPAYFFGQKVGPDPEEQGYKARTVSNPDAYQRDDTGRILYNDYGQPQLKEGYGSSDAVEYYKTIDVPRLDYDSFMQQYGATPAGGWSDSNTKGASGLFSLLGGGVGTNNPMQRWMQDSSYLPNFSLYGSGTPEDIQRGFNILQSMSPQNIHEFWYLDPATQRGMLENPGAALQQMKATANPANRDWLSLGAEGGFSSMDAFKWDPEKGLTVDPSKYLTIHDGKSWTKPLSILGSVLSFTPLAPLGMAMNVVAAAANKNPLGVLASVLPATGFGNALGEGIGGLTGLGANASNAIASGLISGGMSALGGGGLKGALTSGLLGGLGSYAGSSFGDMFKDASPLTQAAVRGGLSTGMGALSAGLRGGNIGQGALGGLAGGVAGGLGQYIGSAIGDPLGYNSTTAGKVGANLLGGVTNQAVRTALMKKLYK